MELHVNVKNKVATYQQRGGHIVCGNSDYTIRFLFDDEWGTVQDKTARFIWNGVYQDRPIVGGVCSVPTLYNAEQVEVGVYDTHNDEMHTTTSATIPCLKSILCFGPEPDPGSGEDYESICLEAARAAAESAQRAAESAQQAAESATTAQGLPPVTEDDNGKILRVVSGDWAIVDLPVYDGATEVTPSPSEQTLDTAGTYLTNNISVNPIEYAEVKNTSGGKTVTIGG